MRDTGPYSDAICNLIPKMYQAKEHAFGFVSLCICIGMSSILISFSHLQIYSNSFLQLPKFTEFWLLSLTKFLLLFAVVRTFFVIVLFFSNFECCFFPRETLGLWNQLLHGKLCLSGNLFQLVLLFKVLLRGFILCLLADILLEFCLSTIIAKWSTILGNQSLPHSLCVIFLKQNRN